MRKIKFRGKRVDNGEWVYGYLIEDLLTDYCAILKFEYWQAHTYKEEHSILKETVGQFTGLLDKNGKEIYEGDLLDLDGNEDDYEYILVWFKDGKFVAYWYGDVGYDTESGFQECGGPIDICDTEDLSECKRIVIGNIHDNPELLEVKQ